MRITDLKPQIKNPERYNVYCDGVYYCSLMAESVVKAKLNIGREVTEDRLDEILRESEVSYGFEKALNYLGRKRCSEKEVWDNLIGKGFEESVAAAVVAKCCEYGYLDDAAYAHAYVQSYRKTKGELRLRRELRQKGVEDSLIDAALEEEDGFEIAALEQAEKYLKGRSLDLKTKAGLYRFLASKGYPNGTVYEIIGKLFDGNEED